MTTTADANSALDRAEGLLSARRVPAAREAFLTAERLGADPDRCSGGRWLAGMLAGDFESAWQESDAIRARGAPDEHRFWLGEDLRGKRVIVRALHGYGDAVQMLRFAPAIAERAASVVFEVPPRFVELAHCLPGVNHVITWGENAPPRPPPFDVQVEVMELPYLLRLDAMQLPYASGYLQLPEAEIERVQTAMGSSGEPRIGLVWSCGEWNRTRGVPAEKLAPLLATPHVGFWSLEMAGYVAEAERLGLANAEAVCGEGLLALAATIASLDLVITVDTLAAHLAGALGKPVWLLLQHAADWRWMIDRSDSPWYPSMRIFRQPKPGDWASVVHAVSRALTERLIP